MEDDRRILVTIVARTDTPLSVDHLCVACSHFVRLDELGGTPLCVVCAQALELAHPGTFSDESRAMIPMDQELTAYPSNRG